MITVTRRTGARPSAADTGRGTGATRVVQIPPEARPHLTKQQYAYAWLRDAILRCELKPGERLIIEELARRVDTSTIPVREAIRLLESEGLVVNIAHVGATVAPISRLAVTETFTVLEGLEMVSTRAAAQRGDPDGFAGLETLVSSMDRALGQSRYDEWASLNTRFHLAITALAGMPMLEQMLQRAFVHWERVRRYFFAGVLAHRTEIAQREHRLMLAQIKGCDLAQLERTVRKHNQGALLHPADGRVGRHPRRRAERSHPQALAQLRRERRQVDMGRRSGGRPPRRTGQPESARHRGADAPVAGGIALGDDCRPRERVRRRRRG
jgi:DNA-binding GntR family transcriptional regulator